MNSEEVFKKFLWRQLLSSGESYGNFTNWTITGIAAIFALIISNLNAVTSIIDSSALKTSLIVLVFSLLFGVATRLYSVALTTGLRLILEMENRLNTPEGLQVLDGIESDMEGLASGLAQPFLWPLSYWLRKAMLSGANDNLKADKNLVRMFCIQLYCNLIHIFLAAVALTSLALGVK